MVIAFFECRGSFSAFTGWLRPSWLHSVCTPSLLSCVSLAGCHQLAGPFPCVHYLIIHPIVLRLPSIESVRCLYPQAFILNRASCTTYYSFISVLFPGPVLWQRFLRRVPFLCSTPCGFFITEDVLWFTPSNIPFQASVQPIPVHVSWSVPLDMFVCHPDSSCVHVTLNIVLL